MILRNLFSQRLLSYQIKHYSQESMEAYLKENPTYKNGMVFYRFFLKKDTMRKVAGKGIAFVGSNKVKLLTIPELESVSPYMFMSKCSQYTQQLYDVLCNDKVISLPIEELDVIAPKSRESFFYNVHPNYYSYCEKANIPIPQEPIIFSQSTRTFNSSDGHLILNPNWKTIDYSANIGVAVTGNNPRPNMKNVQILGYFVANDMFLDEPKNRCHPEYQHYCSRSIERSTPFGPGFMIHQSDYNIKDFVIECKVNGQVRQSSPASDMIFSVPRIVNHMRRYLPMTAFDLILTGTPSGIGSQLDPPQYLKPGDVVTVTVYPIGSITTVILKNKEDLRKPEFEDSLFSM